MPIEIRELSISVKVNTNPQEQRDSEATEVSGHPMPDQEALLAECLEIVTDMLRNKNER